MELEDQTARKTYILLLVEILQKKVQVLNILIQLTTNQHDLIASSDVINDEEFLKLITLKEEKIIHLTSLDEGFDKLYLSVKEELMAGKEKYIAEITSLKELIADITDLSVNLQTMEKRNKSQLDMYFATMRKKIKNSRLSNKTVANYYKTMTNQHEVQSFFYDKKN